MQNTAYMHSLYTVYKMCTHLICPGLAARSKRCAIALQFLHPGGRTIPATLPTEPMEFQEETYFSDFWDFWDCVPAL